MAAVSLVATFAPPSSASNPPRPGQMKVTGYSQISLAVGSENP